MQVHRSGSVQLQALNLLPFAEALQFAEAQLSGLLSVPLSTLQSEFPQE